MKIFDVRIDAINLKEARAALDEPQVIFTPNPEILLEARRNKAFAKALKSGTLMLPDGHGLQFVSTLLKLPSRFLRVLLYLPALLLFLFWKRPFKTVFPEIIHGSDFMDEVVNHAASHGFKVFFLGGRGTAQGTADYFLKKYPALKVAGTSSTNPSREAMEEVKRARAQVLFVAYGAPKQELWIAKYHKQVPQVFHIMGVGGSFDFYSGEIRRAPNFLRKLGLEWRWRLLMNPFQRVRRIWYAVVIFSLLTILKK